MGDEKIAATDARGCIIPPSQGQSRYRVRKTPLPGHRASTETKGVIMNLREGRKTAMRMRYLIPVVALLVSACGDSGGGPSLPPMTSPSAVLPSVESLSTGAGGSADGSDVGRTTAPPPIAPALPGTAAPAVAWRPAAPIQSTQSVSSVAAPFTLDGSSRSTLVSSTDGRLGAALVGPPALDWPSVDIERRTVTVTWSRGFGDAPVFWILQYTAPGGVGGSFDIPGTTTSITAQLPYEGGYSVRVRGCDAAGCSDWSQTRTFELRSSIPGPPRNVRATANGTTVTMSWDPPATGGPPTTYVVVFNGEFYPVGLATAVSGTVAPGRYLLAVLARNASGDSAAVTVEVTVLGPTTQGTYSGSFSGSGPITRVFTWPATCTWQVTFTGTITLSLTQQLDGLTGSIRVSGTRSEPPGTSTSPSFTCLPGSGSYDDTQPVIISGTNIARTGLSMSHSTGTFSGNLSGTTVTGTLSAKYNNGTGTVVMPVTLTKR